MIQNKSQFIKKRSSQFCRKDLIKIAIRDAYLKKDNLKGLKYLIMTKSADFLEMKIRFIINLFRISYKLIFKLKFD